jgi:hypothetical protein
MDHDVAAAARELAEGGRRSLGSVISEFARRGLTLRGSRPATTFR